MSRRSTVKGKQECFKFLPQNVMFAYTIIKTPSQSPALPRNYFLSAASLAQ